MFCSKWFGIHFCCRTEDLKKEERGKKEESIHRHTNAWVLIYYLETHQEQGALCSLH